MLLSTVGTDLETGQERMTFGLQYLSDGIDFAVLAMGMFGIAEILRNLDHTETRDVVKQRDRPPAAELAGSASSPPARSCAAPRIGAILGILPGNGAVLGPFASYTIEKKLAQGPAPLRPGRHRGRRRARRAPTTPARRPPSSRC